jgi:hypothetical protein
MKKNGILFGKNLHMSKKSSTFAGFLCCVRGGARTYEGLEDLEILEELEKLKK